MTTRNGHTVRSEGHAVRPTQASGRGDSVAEAFAVLSRPRVRVFGHFVRYRTSRSHLVPTKTGPLPAGFREELQSKADPRMGPEPGGNGCLPS